MKKILLIDGHSILNRAFFGMPDLTCASGEHTGAVYGFLNIIFKVIENEKPTHITVAFDVHEPTFRHKMFDAYKGTRKPMAPELKMQVPMIQELLKAMGVTVVTLPGFEADDILGTLSCLGEKNGFEVTVLSGDRDLLQLATDKVKISIPKTKSTGTEVENYFAKDVIEAYEVTPKEFIDVKALWGDTADNIPGVESIGEKTAKAIISTYHSIENAHEHASEIKPPKASRMIVEQWDRAVLSKTLATIDTNAPVEYDFNAAEIKDFYTPAAYTLMKKWEFKNYLSRFDASVAATALNMNNGFVSDVVDNPFEDADSAENVSLSYVEKFSRIENPIEFFDLVEKSKTAPTDVKVACDLCTAKDEVVALTICIGDECYYIPASPEIVPAQLTSTLVDIAGARHIYMWDIKENMHAIYSLLSKDKKEDIINHGGKAKLIPNADDVKVLAYLLNPIKNDYTPENISLEFLGINVPGEADIFGKNKIADALFLRGEEAFKYCCVKAYVTTLICDELKKRVKELEMEALYTEIEHPLIYTLFDMEIKGIAMDAQALRSYGDSLAERIAELEQAIYGAAGEEFNINSPKQLGVILFEKMGIPGGKKTKTGYSTAADVLEELKLDNPIINDILEYRQLAKLKSTYADGLMTALSPDGRIHSTFQQTVTATGRISSTEPNLQNIPIRMELGKQIRKVFYAADGFTFLDADYSQIELRVIAHLSGDDNLVNAFKSGQDIHKSTASLVFHTPFDEVTELQRRRAKAVNFGIVYGISAFGLAADIGCDRKEAKEYIDNYFVAYPKLKEFLDGCVAGAKEKGFITTMFGRRRPIPEISSSAFMTRAFGERVAMNSPVQGTAADIIKLAMVKVHDRLYAEGLESRLILQVHDELLIETKETEFEKVNELLVEEMTNAVKLLVDLEVDAHSGKTWFDAK